MYAIYQGTMYYYRIQFSFYKAGIVYILVLTIRTVESINIYSIIFEDSLTTRGHYADRMSDR
jgi:hypothetical protein